MRLQTPDSRAGAREGKGRQIVRTEEAGRVRVVSRRELTPHPLRAVQEEHRCARPGRVVKHVDQSGYPHLETGLLPRLADRGLDRRFPLVQVAGGKAPLPDLGLHGPANEEQPAILDHHHPHPHLRLHEVHPAALGAGTARLAGNLAGCEGGGAADAMARVLGGGRGGGARFDGGAPGGGKPRRLVGQRG